MNEKTGLNCRQGAALSRPHSLSYTVIRYVARMSTSARRLIILFLLPPQVRVRELQEGVRVPPQPARARRRRPRRREAARVPGVRQGLSQGRLKVI